MCVCVCSYVRAWAGDPLTFRSPHLILLKHTCKNFFQSVPFAVEVAPAINSFSAEIWGKLFIFAPWQSAVPLRLLIPPHSASCRTSGESRFSAKFMQPGFLFTTYCKERPIYTLLSFITRLKRSCKKTLSPEENPLCHFVFILSLHSLTGAVPCHG